MTVKMPQKALKRTLNAEAGLDISGGVLHQCRCPNNVTMAVVTRDHLGCVRRVSSDGNALCGQRWGRN